VGTFSFVTSFISLLIDNFAFSSCVGLFFVNRQTEFDFSNKVRYFSEQSEKFRVEGSILLANFEILDGSFKFYTHEMMLS